MTKRPAKPRRVKARVMWIEESQTDSSRYVLYTTRAEAVRDSVAGGVTYGPPTPVLLIPRTAAAYDALLEQMARALADYQDGEWCNDQARAALQSIGITRPRD